MTALAMVFLVLAAAGWIRILLLIYFPDNKHKHVYVVVRESWTATKYEYDERGIPTLTANGYNTFVRDEYDFCVKCGEQRNPIDAIARDVARKYNATS